MKKIFFLLLAFLPFIGFSQTKAQILSDINTKIPLTKPALQSDLRKVLTDITTIAADNTATQTSLDLLAPKLNPTFTGNRLILQSNTPTVMMRNTANNLDINVLELGSNQEIKFGNGGMVIQGNGGPNSIYVQNNNGNVGIGTNAPTAKLEVNGNIKFGNGTDLQTALDNTTALLSNKQQTVSSITELKAYTGNYAYFEGSGWERKAGNVSSNGGSYSGTIINVSSSYYWERKISGKVEARYFGIFTTNSDNKVQIDLLLAAGFSNAYFPKGVYMTDGGHTLPPNFELFGDGESTVIKLKSGFTQNSQKRMFTLSSGNNIHDIYFDGNYDNNLSNGASTALMSSNAATDNVKLSNIHVENFQDLGISIVNTTNFMLFNSTFYKTRRSSIRFVSCKGVKLIDNNFNGSGYNLENGYLPEPPISFQSSITDDVIIRGNKLVNAFAINNFAIETGGARQQCNNWIVSNNIFDGAGNIGLGISCGVNNFVIEGNIWKNSVGSFLAIECSGSNYNVNANQINNGWMDIGAVNDTIVHNINITNNTIVTNANFGRSYINIGGGYNGIETNGIKISNNIIDLSKSPVNSSNVGIGLGYYAMRQVIRNATVSNNTIIGRDDAGSNLAGISLTASYGYNIIINNNTLRNLYTGINTDGFGVYDNSNIVRDNTIYGSGYVAINLPTSMKVINNTIDNSRPNEYKIKNSTISEISTVPTNNLTANIGSLALNNSGTGNPLFVKTSGTGNTGWSTIPFLEASNTWTGANSFTGGITGITSANVTTALGFTPYNSSNPTGFITGSSLSPYLLTATASSTYQPLGSYLTGITSGNVTTALGFTPYNSSNPTGFITSSALSGYALLNGTQTIVGLTSLQGTTATDAALLGAELLTSSNWTSTGWTGSFASGYTHTTGNTTVLSNTITASSNQYYQISYTVTGRTAGTFDLSFGGVNTTGINSSSALGIQAISSGTLTLTPTSTFDGNVIISIKQIGANAAIISYKNSSGAIVGEKRFSDNTNIFEGINSGYRITTGINNTSIGSLSGGSLTSGSRNAFFGNSAGISLTTGQQNTIVGNSAGYSISSGNNNSFIGNQSGYYTTTGGGNNFMGNSAGRNNTTGSSNQFIGSASGNANTTASNNVAIGDFALTNNTTGSSNVSIGSISGNALLSGSNNIFLGNSAGRLIQSGGNNTISNNSLFLGANSTALGDNQSNQIVIGYNAIGNGSNTTVIGSTSTIQTQVFGPLVLAQTAQPTVSSTAVLDIQSTTKGVLIPRMTTSQRDAISSPATGLELYCTDCTAIDASTGVKEVWNGSVWKRLW